MKYKNYITKVIYQTILIGVCLALILTFIIFAILDIILLRTSKDLVTHDTCNFDLVAKNISILTLIIKVNVFSYILFVYCTRFVVYPEKLMVLLLSVSIYDLSLIVSINVCPLNSAFYNMILVFCLTFLPVMLTTTTNNALILVDENNKYEGFMNEFCLLFELGYGKMNKISKRFSGLINDIKVDRLTGNFSPKFNNPRSPFGGVVQTQDVQNTSTQDIPNTSTSIGEGKER